MLKPKFHGKIVKAEFLVDDYQADQRHAYLQGLEGQRVDEIIGKYQQPKTNPQLAYFHGVVCEVASEVSGYTKEEVKGLLKGEFLTKYVLGPTGKNIAWVPSLEGLKKDEMSEFIDNCIILIAKHWHAVVPPPDEVSYQEQV